MSFGMSVVNLNDVVVIDSDYSNYGVFSEGILTNGSAPLTTIYSDELVFYSIDANGGWASFAVIEGVWFSNTQIRYIRMRPLSAKIPGNEQYGLRVFNNQSKMVFDSSSTYIKPVGMYSYLPYGSATNYTVPTPFVGKRVWFSGQVFKFIECQDTEMGFGEVYCSGLRRNSQNSWTISNNYSSVGPPATFGNTFSAFSFLVIEA